MPQLTDTPTEELFEILRQNLLAGRAAMHVRQLQNDTRAALREQAKDAGVALDELQRRYEEQG